MNRLPAKKNKPNSNPILSAVGGFQMNLKSLARKSDKLAIRKILGIFQNIPIFI